MVTNAYEHFANEENIDLDRAGRVSLSQKACSSAGKGLMNLFQSCYWREIYVIWKQTCHGTTIFCDSSREMCWKIAGTSNEKRNDPLTIHHHRSFFL
jgi:hypothetical protein